MEPIPRSEVTEPGESAQVWRCPCLHSATQHPSRCRDCPVPRKAKRPSGVFAGTSCRRHKKRPVGDGALRAGPATVTGERVVCHRPALAVGQTSLEALPTGSRHS